MEGNCRTCLIKSSSLSTIFRDDLPSKIKTISSIEVKQDDKLSDKICSECVKKLNVCYTFRNLIIKCDSLIKLAASEDDSTSPPSCEHICINQPNRDDIDDNIDTDNNCDVKMEVEDTGEFIIKDYNLKEESTLSDSESCKSTKRVNKYQCKECYFQAINRKELAKHSASVHKRMVNCEICALNILKTNLKKHMVVHSTKDESISCPICKRVFKNWLSYRHHPKVHIPEESTCEICGKQFQFQGERVRHLYRHNGKKQTHTCEICGKVFHKLELFKNHQRVHTGERPHVCSFCGKKFTSRWAMRTHERQHTNETPYKCQLCPMAFRQGVSLRTHMRSKH